MRAVGAYCHAQLTAAGVQATPPQGGYYMMPNFEIIREGLAARGITTGQQMCEAMFDECGVAVSNRTVIGLTFFIVLALKGVASRSAAGSHLRPMSQNLPRGGHLSMPI